MKRVIVTASHHRMADGLKETLNFITGGLTEVVSLSAYIDNPPVEEEIDELMNGFADEDEVVVLVDMMGGSVYQKFYPYMSDKVHVICGMSLPMALSFVLAPEDECLTSEDVEEMLMECKNQLVYVNKMAASVDEDDE